MTSIRLLVVAIWRSLTSHQQGLRDLNRTASMWLQEGAGRTTRFEAWPRPSNHVLNPFGASVAAPSYSCRLGQACLFGLSR